MFPSESFLSKRSICKVFMLCSQKQRFCLNHLQQVVVFGKHNDRKSTCRSSSKMNFDAYVTMFNQLKTYLARIHLRRKIKSKQSTTVVVLFSRDSVPCVAIILTRLHKQMNITLNKTIVVKIRLKWFQKDLNSVAVNRHEIDAVVFEIKKGFGVDIAVCVVVDYTIHHLCGQLSQNKFFLVMVCFPVGTVKLLTSTRRSGYFVVPCCKALT